MSETVYNLLRSTFGLAMLGAALLWAALPPLDFTPLAWIAPVFWVSEIRSASPRTGVTTPYWKFETTHAFTT